MAENQTVNWKAGGKEPDCRFSLANERTFLARIRTALAVLAIGILLHQFALHIEPRWLVTVLAVLLAVISAFMGIGAYVRWKGMEIAMRHDRPLPSTSLMPVLASAMTVVAGVIAAALLK